MKYGLVLFSFMLVACSTPITILKNEKTGQIVRCGGERSGSIAGGMIGYSLQKEDAEKCVQDYQSQDFKTIEKRS